MGRGLSSWLLVTLLLACTLQPRSATAAGGINSASARLEFSGGYIGAETMSRLQRALDAVVHTAIIEQLGGDLAYINANRKAVVDVLGTAVEETLATRGFNLREMSLETGPETLVTVRLEIGSKRIRDISVRFFILGNTPLINAVTDPDAADIATALYATVARTPMGEDGWLIRIIREGVEQELARQSAYRDFVYEVFVEPGESTRVVVAFTPRPAAMLIGSQRLDMHSVTLLNLQLHELRERSAYYMTGLVGAPRSFVDAKLGELTSALLQQLAGDCSLLEECPDAELQLSLSGSQLLGHFYVDSTQTLLQASVRLDLRSDSGGPDEIYGRLRLRGGMVPQPGWAVYAGLDYYAGEDHLYPMLGAARLLRSRGYIGGGYDFHSQSMRFEGMHEITPKAYVSADYFGNRDFDHLSEVALHWRLQHAYELQLGASLDGGVFAAVGANF
jgi:hypothetical protein